MTRLLRLYYLLTLAIMTLPIGTMHTMSRLSSNQLAPYARQAAQSLLASPSITPVQLQKQHLPMALARNAQAIKLTMPAQQRFVSTLHSKPTQHTEIPKFDSDHAEQSEESSGILDFVKKHYKSLTASAALGLGAYALHEQEVVLAEEEVPKRLLQYYIDNFATINPHLLKDLLDHYPEAAQTFVQPAIDNFSKIDLSVPCEIIKHYPEAAQAFFQHVIINNSSYFNKRKLIRIMERYPEATQVVVQSAIDNFKTVDQWFLTAIMDHHPEAAKAFLKPTVALLSSHDDTPACKNLCNLIHEIIKHYPQAKGLLLRYLAKNPHTFYPFTDLYENTTQSKQHLIAKLGDKHAQISSQGNVNYQDHPHLQAMTQELFTLEDAEQQKGRYTFVHGHQWKYHFHQEIYTDLWTIFNHKVSNYRFVRFNPKLQFIYDYDQNHCIFLNYAFFTNPHSLDNSAYYIARNYSWQPPKQSISFYINSWIDAFELNNYFSQSEIQIIKDKLDELWQEHETLSQYGSGLLFSMTPELMKKCVYPSHAYGVKRTVTIKGIGETSDPKMILDVLRIAPEKIYDLDTIQFVCVLTHDLALKPNNGLDIYEFNAADKEKLAAWRAKKDELIHWIKERVKEKQAAARA